MYVIVSAIFLSFITVQSRIGQYLLTFFDQLFSCLTPTLALQLHETSMVIEHFSPDILFRV